MTDHRNTLVWLLICGIIAGVTALAAAREHRRSRTLQATAFQVGALCGAIATKEMQAAGKPVTTDAMMKRALAIWREAKEHAEQ